MRTGFSPVEIFRKYMWYLLRERQFDQEAVTDMVHLKQALGLKNEQACLVFPLGSLYGFLSLKTCRMMHHEKINYHESTGKAHVNVIHKLNGMVVSNPPLGVIHCIAVVLACNRTCSLSLPTGCKSRLAAMALCRF